jgi:SAM-dependent methyltransferase
MGDSFASLYLSGDALYGDDFGPEAIAQWYREEEYGFFHIATSQESYEYDWHGVNRLHGYSAIAGRHFKRCLAFGCARGDDVAPIAGQVDEFIAVEPAEQWWSDSINGVPAHYVKPTVLGDLALARGTVDLAVTFGVLHHIPNVSHVLAEIARVLGPRGIYLLREPICTMGDWRRPRGALTRHERGLPPGWLRAKLRSLGFRILRERYCAFPGVQLVSRSIGFGQNLNNGFVVWADRLLCLMLRWNLHYHRDTLFKQIAPTSVFYVLEKELVDVGGFEPPTPALRTPCSPN